MYIKFFIQVVWYIKEFRQEFVSSLPSLRVGASELPYKFIKGKSSENYEEVKQTIHK